MIKGLNVAELLHALALTRDEEIDCTTCLDLVPAYVDRQVFDGGPSEEMASVETHLALCPDCREEYEAVLELARLETAGDLPGHSPYGG